MTCKWKAFLTEKSNNFAPQIWQQKLIRPSFCAISKSKMKEEKKKKKKKLVRLVKAALKCAYKAKFEISHSVIRQSSSSAWYRLPSQFSDGDRNHSVCFTEFLVIRSHIGDAYFLVTSSSTGKAHFLVITNVFPETHPHSWQSFP